MAGHFLDGAFHALKPRVGRGADIFGHLGARRVDSGRHCGRQLFKADIGCASVDPALRAGQSAVQVGEGDFKPAHGLAGAGLGLFKPLADTGDHRLDDVRRGRRGRLTIDQLVDVPAQFAKGLAGAGLTVVEMAGDLRQGRFHRAQSLHRTRAGGVLLGAAQALDDAGLFDAHIVHRPFETGGHGGLFTLVGGEAGDQAGHRLVDAADRQGRPVFGGLDPGRQSIEGLGDPEDLVGGMLRGLDAAVGCGRAEGAAPGQGLIGEGAGGGRAGIGGGAWGRLIGIGVARRGLVVDLDAAVLQDHLVQPFAQRHPRPTGKILGDLPGLGVDALDAPRRSRAHPNRSPQHCLRTLGADLLCVNATLTLNLVFSPISCG